MPLLILIVIVLILAFGPLAFSFLWSPVAALITACVAKRRGLTTCDYALTGALKSLVFVVPWVRLVIEMCMRDPNGDGKVSNGEARLMYAAVFMSWLIVAIGALLTMAVGKAHELASIDDEAFLQFEGERMTQMGIVAVVGFIGALISLANWALCFGAVIRSSSNNIPMPLPASISSYAKFQIDLESEYHKFRKPWLFFFGWLIFDMFYLMLMAVIGEQYPLT